MTVKMEKFYNFEASFQLVDWQSIGRGRAKQD